MRYRVKDYSFQFPAGDVQLIIIDQPDLTIEDIRLIVNETKNKVICSSMQKDNVIVSATQENKTYISVPKSVCVLSSTDQLTIEIDRGEEPGSGGGEGYEPAKVAFEAMQQMQPYLTAIEYDSLDYEAARAHIIEQFGGSCTCVWKDGKLARNYDYNINYAMDYLVRVKAHNGKAASIGFASVPELTSDNCNTYSDEYKWLPFRALDGMNEHGLGVAILLLNSNSHNANGNTPEVEERETISAAMLDRYILDNFHTATEAVQYIRDYVRVKPIMHNGTKKEVHFMVADKTDCYALEFIGTNVVATHLGGEGELPAIMANFLVDNLSLISGVVGFDNLEDYAQGVERYQIAQAFLQGTGDLMTLMTGSLRYTNLYTDTANKWLTDCSGDGVTYKQTAQLTARWGEYHDFYVSKTKEELRADGRLWQTLHSVVYDLNQLTMRLTTQESQSPTEIDCFPSATGNAATLENQQKMMVNFGMSEGMPELVPLTDNEILTTYQAPDTGIADTTYGHRQPVEVTIDDIDLTCYQERTYADYGYSALYDADGNPYAVTNHPQEGDQLYTTND